MKFPHTIEYERSVLCMLIDLASRVEEKAYVFDALDPEDFYKLEHRLIFTECIGLHQRKAPIDAATVADAIGKKINQVGIFIAHIVDALPATDVHHYCDTLRSYTKARKTLASMAKWSDEIQKLNGNTPREINEILDSVQADILKIDARGMINFLTPKMLMSAAIDEYTALRSGGAGVWISSGFRELDNLVNIRGSKFIIIAARPSVGKSALMFSMARMMAMNGNIPAIFELEMDRQTIIDRWVAMEADLNLMHLSYGSGPGDEAFNKIMRIGQTICDWNIIVDDEGGLWISELKRRIRIAKKQGAEVVFVDQLSQIRGNGKTEYERNTNIVQELSKLKKEIDIPVILLCQISRKQDESKYKKPEMFMLKTTGAIEEEADIVLLIDRPYIYEEDPELKDKAVIYIAKNRNGPIGPVGLGWNPSRAMFKEKDE